MKTSTVLMVLGVFFALGGLLALAFPFVATMAVTTFVGAVFLVGGVLGIWFAFRDAGQPHRFWNGFIGLMGVIAGVSLLANPFSGAISLTIILAVLFLLTGAARVAGAFSLRGTPLFWMLLVSGVVSIVLSGLIFYWFPAVASSLLGILLGFELIAEGAALIALGVAARKFP